MPDGDERFDVEAPYRRVRVWFGQTAIADHTDLSIEAAWYEQAMRRRFAGLRVTSDPAVDAAGNLAS
jgi:hypothetical protein